MTSHLVVSFTTRPTAGGEGGVGWSFLKGAAQLSATENSHLHAVIDSRDHAEVALAVQRDHLDVTLHPVPLPPWARRKWGESRSRGSYLAWLRRAKAEVASLARSTSFASAHQFTFATMSMPPVVTRRDSAATIWGPVTAVTTSVPQDTGSVSVFQVAGTALAKRVTAMHLHRAALVVATNDATAEFVEPILGQVVVEPNIVAEPRPEGLREDYLVMSGLLIARKRPWIALQAMRDPRLRGRRLVVVGDGPLRTHLESFVRQERLEDRVRFLGALTRDDAMSVVARGEVLLHPSAREGSPWAVGEAAAAGVRAVVYSRTGADTTARLSNNSSQIVPDRGSTDAFVEGILTCLGLPPAAPTSRWSSRRLPELLQRWRSTATEVRP